MKALFVGRGPFSKVLQKILLAVAPGAGITEIGKTDAESAVASFDYDTLFLVCPPQAHVQLLPLAWARGKSAWVEKPFGASHVDAEHLVAEWTWHGSPPCYVDFPHLRLPIVEKFQFTFPLLNFFAVVGGPGPSRPYMSNLWDWGAHVAAMFVYAGGVKSEWRREDFTLVEERALSSKFILGKLKTRLVAYRLAGLDRANEPFMLSIWDDWRDLPTEIQPLTKAMGEMVDGHPRTHPNWSPKFAAQVTELLEAFGPCATPRNNENAQIAHPLATVRQL